MMNRVMVVGVVSEHALGEARSVRAATGVLICGNSFSLFRDLKGFNMVLMPFMPGF